MLQILNIGAMVLVGTFAIYLLVYGLAKNQFMFTTIKEGTVVFVMLGGPEGTFDHCLMSWKKHYLNDPRRGYFDPSKPEWEVLEYKPEEWRFRLRPSPYRIFSPWRLFARVGIYYFGISPFKAIHEYNFEWSEVRVDDQGDRKPWHRKERTRLMYVSDFVYWAKLEGAEDEDNMPLDLDYLLTTAINNPRKARFDNTNWLTRTIADTNSGGRIWVSQGKFEAIKKELNAAGESGFVKMIKEVNKNLPTDHEEIGARDRIGVTIKASSLQSVTLSGTDADELVKATVAPIVAKKNAEAVVEKAKGDAEAVKIAADAEKNRIDTVYGAMETSPARMKLRELDAMQNAKGTVIWAPEALQSLERIFPPRPPQTPAEPG
jgi:hypothetical protein